MRWPRLAAVCGLGAALAGCGSAGPHASVARGHAVFARSCAACHSLAGRELGRPGGDLRRARLSAADVASFAAIMPVRPRLTKVELDSVGLYVAAQERPSP